MARKHNPGRGKCIPQNFAQWGESPEGIDKEIEEGSYLRCFPAEIFSPCDFYVNLTEMWYQLETFMAKLQQTIQERNRDYDYQRDSTPVLELLAPGLFVLCKYFGPKDKRPEWHRAIVLKNSAYDDTVPGPVTNSSTIETVDGAALPTFQITVRLVDFGTIHETTLQNTRYMDQLFLKFPIQAIHCEMTFPESQMYKLSNQGHRWPKIASDTLFELCEGRNLGVTFLKMARIRSIPGEEEIYNGKWSVGLDLVEGKKTISTKIDISKEIMDDNEPPAIFDEKVQAEIHRRLVSRRMDPSLTRHPNGVHSTLVDQTNINVRFIRWIKDRNEDEE